MIRLLRWFFWRRKGAGLTFQQAWWFSEPAGKLRRKAWAPGAYICVLHWGSRDFVHLYYRSPGGYRVKFWQPYAVDFLAEDWEVFD